MQDAWDRDILEHRREKDRTFQHDAQSPLPDLARATFHGLRYFPTSKAHRVEATWEPAAHPRKLVMPTSDGAEKEYLDAGVLRFELEGAPVALKGLISPGRPHELFVPFRDATSGKETYGAGRYLEVPIPARGERAVVDLNMAYNPWCAYSEDYSCPLPPVENWLKVPIRAGEMTFSERS